jgi:hypothetical protein
MVAGTAANFPGNGRVELADVRQIGIDNPQPPKRR